MTAPEESLTTPKNVPVGSCADDDKAVNNSSVAVAAIEKMEPVVLLSTSMAAPHVSGVIAAFLSVRTEFIGKAERVKDIFVTTATDLRRDRYFQGAGLVDLMLAIQSV